MLDESGFEGYPQITKPDSTSVNPDKSTTEASKPAEKEKKEKKLNGQEVADGVDNIFDSYKTWIDSKRWDKIGGEEMRDLTYAGWELTYYGYEKKLPDGEQYFIKFDKTMRQFTLIHTDMLGQSEEAKVRRDFETGRVDPKTSKPILETSIIYRGKPEEVKMDKKISYNQSPVHVNTDVARDRVISMIANLPELK